MLSIQALHFFVDQCRNDTDRVTDFVLAHQSTRLGYGQTAWPLQAFDVIPAGHLHASIAGYCALRCSRQDNLAARWHYIKSLVSKHVAKPVSRITKAMKPYERIFVLCLGWHKLYVIILCVQLHGVMTMGAFLDVIGIAIYHAKIS